MDNHRLIYKRIHELNLYSFLIQTVDSFQRNFNGKNFRGSFMNKLLCLAILLCLSGCTDFNKEFPLTPDNNLILLSPDDRLILPSVNPIGTPTEASISQIADMLVVALNKSREETERKENLKNGKAVGQTDTVNQALQSFVEVSKKQGAGEITLFFSSGSDSLEFSYTERDRLVQFLDFLSRESHGRKILLLSIGSASVTDTASNKYQVYDLHKKKSVPKKSGLNKIQLSVARAKAPLGIIEKYLVNIPHQTYDAYGVGERKSADSILTPTEQERYQHVRIVAAFEKADLPLLPK